MFGQYPSRARGYDPEYVIAPFFTTACTKISLIIYPLKEYAAGILDTSAPRTILVKRLYFVVC